MNIHKNAGSKYIIFRFIYVCIVIEEHFSTDIQINFTLKQIATRFKMMLAAGLIRSLTALQDSVTNHE